MLQVPEVRKDPPEITKQLTARRGATKTEGQTPMINLRSIMPRQATEQVFTHNTSALTLLSNKQEKKEKKKMKLHFLLEQK